MEGHSVPSAPRRRRVAVACDLCRKRKMKCDGSQPTCTYCHRRRLVCVYQEPQQRVQVTQAYLTRLLRRVDELQRSNSSNSSNGSSGLHDRHDRSGRVSPDDISPYPLEESHSATSSLGQVVGTRDGDQDVDIDDDGDGHSTVSAAASVLPSPDTMTTASATFNSGSASDCPVDAMVCVGPSPQASAGASASYYGHSSTLAFLRTLQSTVFRGSAEELVEQHADASSRDRRANPYAPAAAPSPPPLQLRLLPPRATADHLVDVYFSHVADLYTIVHESSFRRTYETLWEPASTSASQQPDSLWLCTLNCVLALACMFSDRVSRDESKHMADTFYRQARDLCPLDRLDDDDNDSRHRGGGLSLVQALLLMGQYLQGTAEVNRCWNVFGLAIRIAEGMGLHLNEANNRFPPLAREMRKRCWCGCLVMDAILAMTFGRPMMIPPEYYDIDLPIEIDDDSDVDAVGSNNETRPTEAKPGLLLFTHKLKLYLVLQRILRAFYQAKGSRSGAALLRCGDMAEFDQQLHAWLAQLPPSLQMDEAHTSSPSSSSSSPLCRPRHILYARYLAVRLVLTRPSLAMVARAAAAETTTSTSASTSMTQPLEQAFARSAAETCIATAKHLIQYVRTHLVAEGRAATLGASWYNTHSVFSASLVLFAAQTIPALRPLVVEGPHWADGIAVMRRLAQHFASARACLSIMESFHRHLTETTAAAAQQQRQPPAEPPFVNGGATSKDPPPLLPTSLPTSLPTYFSSPPPGDVLDWLDFLGFDDTFGQDPRW